MALNEQIAEMDKLIEGRFREHELADIVLSVPGIGTTLGAEFLAAVGGSLDEFDSPDALAARARTRHGDGAVLAVPVGTPLYAGGEPYAVLRPRPQFVDWDQLRGLLIFVRNHDELRMLALDAPNGTRIIVLPEQQPPPA